ncbi:conjugal transfer protein TrbH [Rhizobium multihospitium]|uniref:Conjugal transfer protein TrbH n=1 Tax=Rhizobium multihospitium TaxID=410764 RepID=A0A1C3XBT7_9HYPH|nr:conjugal transfer protein TrbH [Rhizobium multihospitium]SCB49606.1 Conjugal transfer protein TrbH [Rhizobium multihospitium]
MRGFLSLILTAVLLAGCQTAGDGLTGGAAPTPVTGPAASTIAGDMASRLAEQIGPAGNTTIKMNKESSEFATALEAALKGWGYAVVTDQTVEKGTKAIELAYSIDSVDGRVLARLSTPPIALGRAYTTTATGAVPASPLSVMRRD